MEQNIKGMLSKSRGFTLGIRHYQVHALFSHSSLMSVGTPLNTVSSVKGKVMFVLVSFLQMARYTTPMYRAPEMVDTWSNHAITTASDVWALGCIMYTLCYMKHPFEDSAKLRILNGNYTIPPGDLKYSCYHDIIRKYMAIRETGCKDGRLRIMCRGGPWY
jgi:serine/threonine protein kinase